jgi:Family of unknown function (DUF6273)
MKVKDLAIGSLVKDPSTLYNGKPILWKVVGRDIEGYPVNSTTLMTDSIISIKTFDSKEPGSTNTPRKTNGNSRWSQSNIRQWLNSQSTSSWFSPQNTSDVAPSDGTNGNGYEDEKGFLSNFSSDFVNFIMETENKTVVPTVDGGGVENSKDKVFLFSMTEMGLAGNTGKEGTVIPYLNSAGNRVLKPTQEAIDQSGYKNSALSTSSPYFYWLRSAFPNYGHIVYRISTNGAFTQSIADNDTIGLAPSVNIDSESAISHQDSDGAYVLAFGTAQPEDLSKIAFELKDTVSGNSITNGNKFDKAVKLDWNQDTVKVGFTIELKKNNSVIPYSRNQSLGDIGEYSAIITAKDKAFPENQRNSAVFSFSILPPKVDLNSLGFKITDSLSGNEITDGSKFTGSVKPTWSSYENVNITVNYSLNGSSKGSLSNGGTYRDSGKYSVSYVLSDKNYPENQLTGIINFEITPAPIDWNSVDLNLRDVNTSRGISEGSEFEMEVRPTWDEISTVTYGIIMEYEGNLISFAKGSNLTSIGNYKITIKMTDKLYTTNTKTESVSFRVIQKVTSLGDFEMAFIDVNMPTAADVVISDGKIFKEPVKPYWYTDFPSDVRVNGYSLRRGGSSLAFTPNNDTYTTVGSYTLTVQLVNGAGDTRDYVINFEIAQASVDVEIEVFNDLDETVINDGRIFEEQLVLPTWEDIEGTDIFYTLKYEDMDTEFIRGVTVLSNKGNYVLEFILEDSENASNTKTVTLSFQITEKKVNMAEVDITIVNDITGVPIYDNDVYRGILVKPYWYSGELPDSLTFESWITFNGERREYDKSDEEGVLSAVGSYTLEVRIVDSNFPTNYRVVTRVFRIIAGSVDLSGKEIVIRDKLTDNPINEGDLFRGEQASVQPTWTEYPELQYTYVLYYNGSVLTGYKKDNILREKGNYRITVSASDPNYPENKLETSITFQILDDIGDIIENGDGNGYDEAYLNALPYKLGTPITNTGDYNLLVVRRKKSNFKVSMSEVNFKIVDPDEDQLPLILVDPEVTPSIKDRVEVIYPNYGSEREYKIGSGEWTAYDDGFDVTDNLIVYARYKDPLGYFVEASKEITNIDKMPPDPPVILGFKDGVDIYLTVTPTVEYVYGLDYTATLDGNPYVLGTPIYNEEEEIREYTLTVTAKKRLNGLTATTVRKFTLDSTPPPAPKIIGIQPEIIQESARPDIDGYVGIVEGLTKETYLEQNDFEARLNARLFTLGTLVRNPDSYQFSVTAIKKVNGLRATSIAVFSIIDKIPPAIGPRRLSLEPITEMDAGIAIDGEMVVNRDNGHISIYDDGYLVSKTRELEDLLNVLDKRIVDVDIALRSNEDRVNTLEILRAALSKDVAKLRAKNNEVKVHINEISSVVNYLDFTDESVYEEWRKELSEIDAMTVSIQTEVSELQTRLSNKVESALEIMDGLQTNSSLIGEVTWLKYNNGI